VTDFRKKFAHFGQCTLVWKNVMSQPNSLLLQFEPQV